MARAIPCHVGFWGREAGLVICRNIPDYQFKTMGTRTSRLVSNLDRGRRERQYSQVLPALRGETNVLLLNHPGESQATRFFHGPEGHIELSKRKRQAFPSCLDIGFLTRPATEDGVNPLLVAKISELPLLTWGKESAGDRLDIEIAANLFHIDANLTSTRKRIQGDSPGVGNVERDTAICVD